MGISLGSTAISDIKLGTTQVDKVYLGTELVWGGGTPTTVRALRFTSTGAQTLGLNQSTLGTIAPAFEYSTDGQTWTSWDITTTLSFGSGTDLYIRGSNTILASTGANYTNFVFSTNSPVYCYGSVMHLYDYTQDLTDFPSSSNGRGLKYLFANCTVLVRPPSLSSEHVQSYCYYYMFQNCISLEYLPKLHNINSSATGYADHMFDGCSLIKMSTTADSEYTALYQIPNAFAGSAAIDMFINTGGTFQGTPEGATNTLYTANEVIE